jgi:hypothetical protein
MVVVISISINNSNVKKVTVIRCTIKMQIQKQALGSIYQGIQTFHRL